MGDQLARRAVSGLRCTPAAPAGPRPATSRPERGRATSSAILRSTIALEPAARAPTFVNAGRRTGPEGSTAFYWNGTTSSTFHHIPSDGTGDLQSGGTEIADRYNFPLSNGIPINRPFDIDVERHGRQSGPLPADAVRTRSTPPAFLSQFYDHSVQTSAEGSALLSLKDASNNVQFVVVNGISMTGESGTSFIANWSLLTLIQGFLAAGRYSPVGYANHVEQLPRITITSPNATTNLTNPSTITVGWTREWLRWDGQTYTTAYPSGYAETSALSYTVMYSADNGATWKYMQDDSAATPGVRPSSSGRADLHGERDPDLHLEHAERELPAGART